MINTMNIVYATDSNYVSICAASMVSLLESNRACKEINIFLYGDRLGTNECILENLVSRYDRYINKCLLSELVLGLDRTEKLSVLE